MECLSLNWSGVAVGALLLCLAAAIGSTVLADKPGRTNAFVDLTAAADVTIDAAAPAAARPRLGAISFLHRFGSALNHHVHLHVCATDGVFMPAAGGAGCCAPPAFLPARPITQADLATVT